jgi:hypothetical protein
VGVAYLYVIRNHKGLKGQRIATSGYTRARWYQVEGFLITSSVANIMGGVSFSRLLCSSSRL